LSLGAAILLGAILAPTDPVLASDVQVEHANDRDRVRFGLTGEAGLNDGVAFPFVMLGLGLLGLHDLGSFGWRWFAIDLLWAICGGLAIGWLVGLAVTRVILHVRESDDAAHDFDDFLTLGLIALAYGLALLAHTYGFLAVFAAGLALRRIERESSSAEHEASSGVGGNATAPTPQRSPSRMAGDSNAAPAQLAMSVLTFNERFERIAEVAVVVLIGSLVTVAVLPVSALWFVPLFLLVIRPMSVWIGLRGADVTPTQRRLMGWFGVRGIGSIYYLAYATTHGLSRDLAGQLAGITLAVVATSIVVHGISVTPLMAWYASRSHQRRSTASTTHSD
jgi:NhaP-type Na+/H+ or K+/H+ antiporter